MLKGTAVVQRRGLTKSLGSGVNGPEPAAEALEVRDRPMRRKHSLQSKNSGKALNCRLVAEFRPAARGASPEAGKELFGCILRVQIGNS